VCLYNEIVQKNKIVQEMRLYKTKGVKKERYDWRCEGSDT
jgi:hypothetical protein